MASTSEQPDRRIHRLDQATLEVRLRAAAEAIDSGNLMDDLEVRHLVRVITECSLLLSDVYSEERIARIMHPERGFLSSLVDRLIEEQRRGEGEVLYRVRRLPDDVRIVGDKALFDLGLFGRREVKGFDLEDLGARAYQVAGRVLEQLAEDRRLREFFDQNRLLALPLDEEVVFLRQCAERFRTYADILQRTHGGPHDLAGVLDPGVPVILERAAEEEDDDGDPAGDADGERDGDSDGEPVPEIVRASTALTLSTAVRLPVPFGTAGVDDADPYVEAARGESSADPHRTREQEISAWERILLFSSLDLDRLRSALNATVIDQQQAIETLVDEFSLFAAGTRDPRKPPAYFLVGPTGVGKNHLVESLGRAMEGIWHVDVPMLTIEGPNYTYPSDINELRGATRGFIRSDEEGLLTSFHAKSSEAPLGVILIDEVEKAHSQLLTFFLSIMDRGTTTDNRGTVLNFSNCMLFFTSNLGYSDAQQYTSKVGFLDKDARAEAEETDIRRELRRALKPEFVNRVRMVHFNRLTRASADRILDLELHRISRRYEEVHGLQLELDESARAELIRRGFSAVYGARHLTTTLESVCNVPIARKIRADDRGATEDRDAVVRWLREMRSGERPYDAVEVKRRVLDLARAKLDYDVLRIVFTDGDFGYESVATDAGELPS